MPLTLAERDLVDRFTDLTYPIESLDHAEHVRLAWTLLAERPLLDAMTACRRLLIAYAQHHGAADHYSETVTCIYLLLIRQAMDRFPPTTTGRRFAPPIPISFAPLKNS